MFAFARHIRIHIIEHSFFRNPTNVYIKKNAIENYVACVTSFPVDKRTLLHSLKSNKYLAMTLCGLPLS